MANDENLTEQEQLRRTLQALCESGQIERIRFTRDLFDWGEVATFFLGLVCGVLLMLCFR